MNPPDFDDCKNDCNSDIRLSLFLDCFVVDLELIFDGSIDRQIISSLIDVLSASKALLNCKTGEDGLFWSSFRINEAYDPIKVSYRILEWLADQGYKVSLNLGST